MVHAMVWSVCVNGTMTDQTCFAYGIPPQENYLKTSIVC